MKKISQTPVTFAFMGIGIAFYLLVASGVWGFAEGNFYQKYIVLHNLKLYYTLNSTSYFKPIQLFTYIFANESLVAVLINTWCLYVFGRVVEALMGSKLFILYFFFCSILIGAINVSLDIESWEIYRGGGNILMCLFFATAYFFPNQKMTMLVPFPVSLASKYWVAVFFFASLGMVVLKIFSYNLQFPILYSFLNFGNMLAMVISLLFLLLHPHTRRLKEVIAHQDSMESKIEEMGKDDDE